LVKLLKGRPRKKDVKRYGNGQITHASRAASNVEEATRTAVTARMRHYRVSKTAAKDQHVGSPLGRLVRWGHITPAQYQAGTKFTECIRSYLVVSTAPRDTPKCVEAALVGPMGGVTHEMQDDEAIRRERAVIKRARELIQALGGLDDGAKHVTHLNNNRSHTAVVWEVCIAEAAEPNSIYELGLLREGLNAVHRVLERWRG
jgi:hypothetical protein